MLLGFVLVGLGVLWVFSGALLCLWALWETVLMLLAGRPDWRDYPDLDESLRRPRRRRP